MTIDGDEMIRSSDHERRVLVTGGAGFIGSWVCQAYRDAGWDVVALDDLSSGRRANVPEGVELVVADVRSDRAADFVAGGAFDVVNHHAAQMDVRVSVERPLFDADVNVRGTLRLLEAAVEGGVDRFVFASSGGTVYGEPTELPAPEGHPKRPDSPYGVAKLAAEHYLRHYRRARGLETVSLRYANVYGPRQDPHGEAGVVAIFGRQVLDGEALTVYGDGQQTRDYVYVADAARANLLATRMEVPEGLSIDQLAYNVGTGVETSVNELAEAIQEAAGRRVEVDHDDPRTGELRRSSLDASKLEGRGWAVETPLAEGLRRTLAHLESREGATAG